MTDGSFPVTLSDRKWQLPHLPFRLVKIIQPVLMHVYAEAGSTSTTLLTEEQIDRLARATWQALNHVDPQLTLDEFMSLPFSIADLFSALPSVAQAAGLMAPSATQEASPDSGKLTSTS
jgi:hypothetical protein